MRLSQAAAVALAVCGPHAFRYRPAHMISPAVAPLTNCLFEEVVTLCERCIGGEPGVSLLAVPAQLQCIFDDDFEALLERGERTLIANVTCLSIYLRKPAYADAFRSQTLWRRSITSSLIGVAGTINGGFFNAFTQSEEGYRIVKRDSSLVSLMTHGVPVLGIAAVRGRPPQVAQRGR